MSRFKLDFNKEQRVEFDFTISDNSVQLHKNIICVDIGVQEDVLIVKINIDIKIFLYACIIWICISDFKWYNKSVDSRYKIDRDIAKDI